jgi:acetyltransferase
VNTPHPSRRLADGDTLVLRPVGAHDAPALEALIGGLSPRDRRWRFHGAVNGVTPGRLARMTVVDPARELALVAVGPVGGLVLADVRCVIDVGDVGDVGDAGDTSAEFALMVAAGRRREGIGATALRELRRAARARGLRWLHGSVLADNLPMLGLLRREGFQCTPHRGDATLVVVETCLH